MPEVKLVCEGAIVREGGAILEAHSSCTLVIMEGKNMIVDTSSRQYRGWVLDGLKALGLDPGAVDYLAHTHLHGDHAGNDDLFVSAERVDLSPGRRLRVIAPKVRLVSTPGHTPESVSVFVDGGERWVIAGDAMPTEDNYRKWLPPAIHYDREVAIASMKKIVRFADVVVPGHGRPFRIDR